MSIVNLRRCLAPVLAAIAIAACSNDSNRSPEERVPGNDFRPVSSGPGDIIRIKKDPVRERVWVLTVEDVRVYDAAQRRLIRKIELPNWSVAAFICNPDLVLDTAGSAVISSNVQARLWRIDAESFTVVEREIRLQDRELWDTGFGALVFAADGTLFGVTSAGGQSLWSIDFGKGSARNVEPYAPAGSACELGQFSAQLERSPRS